jgi:hypothetical protein
MEQIEETATDTARPPQQHELPPAVQLQQMVMGKMLTQMIGVTAKLSIADLLNDRPKSVAELAAASGAHERSLYRLLRGLASVGVFAETEPGTFTNTPMSEALRSDARDSIRDFAIFFSHEMHNRVWSDLMHSTMTGGSGAEHSLGMKDFTWFDQYPEFHAVFNNAMTAFSRGNTFPIVQAYDFSGFEKIVDVGGGHGFLLAGILQANPELRGVLYEMPSVIGGAPALLEGAGVADRCEVVGGSFFENVPEGADAYIMKSIIHDWHDDAAATILRNCRKAMKPGGKVLVADMVVPPGNVPHPSKLIDIEMLAMTPGGFERTADEFRALFEMAGLRLTRIVPTMGPISIIEGEAA